MKTLAKSIRNLKSKIQGGFRKLRKNGSPQKSEGNVSVRTQIVEVGLYPADGIYSGYLDSFIRVSRITLTKITAVLMLAFFTLLPGQPKAQSSDLGTTGFFIGPSLSSVSFSGMGNYSQESSIKGTSLLGIQGGVSEKLDIGRFYIKPMVLTGYQSGMANYTTNEGVTTSYKVDYGNVEVPFNIGAKITGPCSLEAGPLFNWI